ncbi:hypothetical protein CK500_03355 [Halorubrum salipaludis]|uniref:Rhomboid family intramembrane serine protease n=1 Tax=Halorubrum salipaludis TaxID=2032630 RepID=A0A2A2FJ38_9EURY|nr:hypothetical protein [Halorubrum salipaludis]PAU84563.1 hypothetical protein CK500_03355 [Halorubrum salipaludis]
MVETTSPHHQEWSSDLALILSVPILLTSILFFTPTSLQQQLALRPTDPQWYTVFTAAYVHAGVDHLQSNVVGYLLAVSYAYWLCLHTRRRRWFRRTTVGLLIVTPIVVNGVDLLLFGTYLPEIEGLSRGFSGVVGGFGGFLLVAFVVAVRDTYNSELAQIVGVALVLLLLQLIDVVYAGMVRPLVAGLVTFGIVMQVIGVLYERGWEIPVIEASPRTLALRAISGTLVLSVLAILVLQMFPGTLVEGGTFVNIVAHGVGLLTGIVLSTTATKVSTQR